VAFTELKTLTGDPIWVNEYGLVLRQPNQYEATDYKGELTVVMTQGGGYIIQGAPEDIAQAIDSDGNPTDYMLRWAQNE
jgi:hypothetical protein